MSSVPNIATFQSSPSKQQARAAGSVRFDWLLALLSAWLLGGLYLDGWAHAHGMVDNSFFTPWHGVFYTGFFAAAGAIGITWLRNLRRGAAWREALPTGYLPSLIGIGIFFIGGVGDLIWHTLFGIEADVEALLSPTHLLLALGMLLILSGPLRAAWYRTSQPSGWVALGPMIVSLILTLALITFFVGYGHPFADAWPTREAMLRHPIEDEIARQVVGAAGIVVQTVLLMSALLFALRRWRLPFGSLTLLIFINSALVSLTHDEYRLLPGAMLAGIGADLIYAWLRPSLDRRLALRVFAFAVPALFYLAYFLTLIILRDNSWSVHLWAGSIVLAGGIGVLLSYAILPPPVEAQALPESLM